AKSILHRDIKPANLYVTRDGTLKVLDFGIARVRDVASGGASATKTGMMLGTPTFMSPEQALSKSSEIDGRSDLWAVGATLFTLLSGHLVH
ncbi:protein kinase domain-containing protein, partial [Salmonella sp. SAL4445]|uniref:protein kinase domain-containing protein n=1 Tax=Salmonella sp. SAL4445 TaxID=3159900 RepID=UPI00397CE60E